MKSDERTWEKLGKIAPYYSVLTAEEFKPENLSAENLTAFFDSGREHMARLIEIVRELSPEFAPGTAVDFGCGVGRTTIPLAEISSMVIAVDIAAEMLRQAGKNCEARHLTNVTFLTTEAFFQLPAGSVNFVHSFIVLQHVPVSEGYQIIAKLISILGNGGIGAIHVTFGDDRPRQRGRLAGNARRRHLAHRRRRAVSRQRLAHRDCRHQDATKRRSRARKTRRPKSGSRRMTASDEIGTSVHQYPAQIRQLFRC